VKQKSKRYKLYSEFLLCLYSFYIVCSLFSLFFLPTFFSFCTFYVSLFFLFVCFVHLLLLDSLPVSHSSIHFVFVPATLFRFHFLCLLLYYFHHFLIHCSFALFGFISFWSHVLRFRQMSRILCFRNNSINPKKSVVFLRERWRCIMQFF
jgi:hypothetical protein